MYDPSVIRLAASYSPDGSGSSLSVEKTTISTPKTTYTAPRRMVGSKRELFGNTRLAKEAGLISRKLFG